MKLSRIAPLAAVALAALATAVGIGGRPVSAADDVTPIAEQCKAFKAGWGAHDAKAMAAVFADNADVIMMGKKISGRAAVEKEFADDHGTAGAMRDSKLTVMKEPIVFVTSDVAVGDADAQIADVYGPDGAKGGPVNIHVTNVWKKIGDKWFIAVSRVHMESAQEAAGH